MKLETVFTVLLSAGIIFAMIDPGFMPVLMLISAAFGGYILGTGFDDQ